LRVGKVTAHSRALDAGDEAQDEVGRGDGGPGRTRGDEPGGFPAGDEFGRPDDRCVGLRPQSLHRRFVTADVLARVGDADPLRSSGACRQLLLDTRLIPYENNLEVVVRQRRLEGSSYGFSGSLVTPHRIQGDPRRHRQRFSVLTTSLVPVVTAVVADTVSRDGGVAVAAARELQTGEVVMRAARALPVLRETSLRDGHGNDSSM
jgi:hypothetical protein